MPPRRPVAKDQCAIWGDPGDEEGTEIESEIGLVSEVKVDIKAELGGTAHGEGGRSSDLNQSDLPSTVSRTFPSSFPTTSCTCVLIVFTCD